MIQNAKIIGCDITPEYYNSERAQRGDPALTVRAHILWEILRNAKRWVRGYKSPESKALRWGSLFDCLYLTPKQYPQRFAVIPSDAPRRPSDRQRNAKKPSPETLAAIEWWDDFEDNHPGEVIPQELNGSVHAAIARLNEDPLIRDLVANSLHAMMITAEWFDRPTGLTVPLKCLIDIVPRPEDPIFSNSLFDLKTTKNASPSKNGFRSDAQRYGYHLQGAFYLAMFNAATQEIRSGFGHVIVENFEPYEYRTPPPYLTNRFLDKGTLDFQRALGIYCQALKTGVWPSYDKGKDWPLTDCDDWFVSLENTFDPLEEPEEETDGETPQEPDYQATDNNI